MKIDKKSFLLLFFALSFAVPILAINWFYLREFRIVFTSINILSGLIIALPIVIIRYQAYRRKKEIEDMFPVFLRDFVEVTRGGMTLPQAFAAVAKNDYRSLSPHVKKIASQLEWGLPVEKVLLGFANRTKSKLIGRIVSSVIESHKYGGNLAETFEALAATSVEIDRLRKERKLYLQSQMITGYIIFFVFLAVVIGLERFLVPSLTQVTPFPGREVLEPEALAKAYRELFRNLILIQGFFAGFTVGKMAEGAMIAGIKHSIFMMAVGAIVFMLLG